MTEPSQDKPAELFTRVQLADQGPQLPIGVMSKDGKLGRDLHPKPWRLKEDKELGRLRQQHRSVNQFAWAGIVLATMYERFGPYDFSSMKLSEKRAVISKCYFGDVLYAWLWLRCAALDNNIVFDIVCNRCFETIKNFPADLETVDIRVADDIKTMEWEHKLKVPISTAGGNRIEALVFNQPIWTPLESKQVTGGLNTGALKGALIEGSLQPVNNVVFPPRLVDEISKRDLELISNEMDNYCLGPDMKVEDTCPHCSNEFKSALDWGYDSFFGIASQS